MTKHPANHLERLKIKLKKDAKTKYKASEAIKTSHLWRAERERDKERETEDELKSTLH